MAGRLQEPAHSTREGVSNTKTDAGAKSGTAFTG